MSNERVGKYPNREAPLNSVPLSETWAAMEVRQDWLMVMINNEIGFGECKTS